MRRILIPCLSAILVVAAADAQASRCVDRVAQFAHVLEVPIGAPGPKGGPAPDPDLGRESGRRTVVTPTVGSPAPHSPHGPADVAKGPFPPLPTGTDSPPGGKPSGKELKAHAKAVLSDLLNAALAAGEEGRSWSCFRKLNVAHAVVLRTARTANEDTEMDWR